MGTKASILIRSDDEQVCLYQHYDGHKLDAVLKSALKRGRNRWEDFGYLARIVFCEMVKDDLAGTENYGLHQHVPPDVDIVIVVDIAAQTVTRKGSAVSFAQFAS